MKPYILGLTGRAGSGKSTIAQHLVAKHGFVRVRLAGPLKAMMAALGLSPDEIEGTLKETPCALLAGKTPRYAMQTIGTEWGRYIISDDLWIRAWERGVERAVSEGAKRIVVDDVRFLNEVSAIWRYDGQICHIERPGTGQGAAGHASEGQKLGRDFVIHNTGSLIDFMAKADMLAGVRVEA